MTILSVSLSNLWIWGSLGTIAITTADTTIPSHRQQHRHLHTSLQSSEMMMVLLPCEILWDSQVRVAMTYLRDEEMKRSVEKTDENHRRITIMRISNDPLTKLALRQCYHSKITTTTTAATSDNHFYPNDTDDTTITSPQQPMYESISLTLIGFKGGRYWEQINQDRAFIIIPTTTSSPSSSVSWSALGVMDGHGDQGHYVAEYVRQQLMDRFVHHFSSTSLSFEPVPMKAYLTQMFVSIDATIPERYGRRGGATTSVVLQIQNHLYFINVGDSYSFLMAVSYTSTKQSSNTTTTTTKVLYQTKPHKPDDPEECARLERVNGVTVKSDHENEEARVWYRSETDGRTYGLAMSRAMGDHDANGILAIPTIDVLDLVTIQKELQPPSTDATASTHQQCVATTTDDDDSQTTTTTITCDNLGDATTATTTTPSDTDWELWVVSVTDGIMDVMSPEEIAKQLLSSTSMSTTKLVSAERLLYQASSRWLDLDGPDYRDDMAIAMMRISWGNPI
jgi:serine/threonine protein phosphatase PrpC